VNSSLDLSKAGSPPLSYTTTVATTNKRDSPPSSLADGEDHPENLSLRRSHSPPPSHHHQQQQHHHSQALHLHQQQQQQYAPPAINLVKMEQLVDNDRRMDQDNIREATLKCFILSYMLFPLCLKSCLVPDLIEFGSCMLFYLVASAATAVSIGIAIRSQRCQTAGWIDLYSATASTTFRNRYCNCITTVRR
jgi:hypothetical protein